MERLPFLRGAEVKARAKKDTAPRAKRAALYLRVSDPTENKTRAKKRKGASTNKDFTSIDAQRTSGMAYIESQNWRFAAEYVDDGRSGKDLKRSSVQRMFADLEAGKIDVVVVYKIDRLSRSLSDFVSVMKRFEARNVAFASVTQNFQTDTPVGKLTLNILASFAEFEREMIIERTRDKIAATRAQGMWSGGLPPLGYDLIDGALVVNHAEAETVRYIFARYLETHSARDVARVLNDEKRPIKVRGKTAAAWTKDMVTRVLRNAVYTGVILHNDETFPGKHDPIVDADTFKRAGARLEANAIEGKRVGGNPLYTLQSVLRCACVTSTGAACDSSMAPGSSGNAKGNYRYYRCVGKEKGRHACPSHPLPADAIETFVVDRLREIAAEGRVAADLAAYTRGLIETHRPALSTQAEALRARVADANERGARLADQMSRAKPGTRRLLESKADEISAEIETLESEQGEIETRISAIDSAQSETAWLISQLESFGGAWDLLTPENQGRLIRGMVRSVDANEKQNRISITFAPLDDTRRALLIESPDSLVRVVEGELYRERGRAVAFTADAPPAPRAPVRRPAKVARMLALAHHVDRSIADGTHEDLADVARKLTLTRARISQVVTLLSLAPDIQAEVLALESVDGMEPIHERSVRPIAHVLPWDKQRAAWRSVIDARKADRAPLALVSPRGRKARPSVA
jgi:DNA invertase Pin-like site-specific DNA recombinase